MDTSGHTSLCEDYVSFETAKLLKKKGFHQPVEFFYTFSGKIGGSTPYDWNQTTGDFQDYSCITLWMAMKWLREVHKIDISVDPYKGEKDWIYLFHICQNKDYLFSKCIDASYENCTEAAIKYCLENLI